MKLSRIENYLIQAVKHFLCSAQNKQNGLFGAFRSFDTGE